VAICILKDSAVGIAVTSPRSCKTWTKFVNESVVNNREIVMPEVGYSLITKSGVINGFNFMKR